MNLLVALTIIRAVAVSSAPIPTREQKAALRVIDRKIQSLERKKAWRDCRPGKMPAHATEPEHPLNAGRKSEAVDTGPGNVVLMWSEADAKKDPLRN